MNLSDERPARVALSSPSGPGDTVTGTLHQLVGAPETLCMISTRDPLPEAIDPTGGELWRTKIVDHRPAWMCPGSNSSAQF